jgi:uncharacterized phage infection (PIP) family protein YhgE
MPTVYNDTLEERLRAAEEAESQMSKLQPLASEAPNLRTEKAKKDRTSERERLRLSHMDQAKQSVTTANDKQARVAELLGSAARAINELYTNLRQIENLHKDANQMLAVVDRIEYEQELEKNEDQDDANARDSRGVAYVLAGKHGESRVKQLMDALQPQVNLLEGCNLDEPLYRDVAHFVMDRVEHARSPRAANTRR